MKEDIMVEEGKPAHNNVYETIAAYRQDYIFIRYKQEISGKPKR